ncbi:MAG TPA: hypothetical protein VFN67_02205, partial [Polyangiales bacterium]|nr:hypothetical protein [Polyangiales bacterium]
PPAPSRFNTNVPAVLDQAVLEAIAYEPSARYADAFQFRAALLSADAEAARLDAPSVAQLIAPVLDRALTRQRAHGPVDHARQTAPRVAAAASSRAHEPTRSLDGIAVSRCHTQPAYAGLDAGTLGWPYANSSARQTGIR